MIDEFTNGFIEEVRELLLLLEDDLIGLEKNPANPEIINNIFRVMHTLKGSAGMVGFKNIQDITHEFESLYVKIREGSQIVNSDIIDLTLKGKDVILSMLEGSENEEVTQHLLFQLMKVIGQSEEGQTGFSTGNNSSVNSSSVHHYVIFFMPDKGIFERGLSPDKSIEEIKILGETHILLHEKKKSWEKQKEEKICQTSWEIYLRSEAAFTFIEEEVFLFYDQEEYRIFEINPGSEKVDTALEEKLGKYYKNKVEAINQVLGFFKNLPEPEVKAVQNFEKTEPVSESHGEIIKTDSESTVNVSSHKLDELMNLVSELVTLTATMQVHASHIEDPKLINTLENVEKLTKKFRNNALDLRLVPVGTLLSKFKRQVRDLSKELGKKVNLLIEGQDIEIDKTILKSIESPLQHIIRNSIDHGLEPEEERLAKGKSPEGLLKITAFYSGASVILQVQDDGRGINLERVKECAIKKGLLLADQVVSKQELISMILEPGFTTNENISIVSGRGVGMDVVRKELNSVGGSVEIFTEKELGTSITMKLPTTLTIIDTLMVDVDDTQILIPVMDIEYCFKESNENLFKRDNRLVEYKNNPIPLISLREQFKYPASEKKDLMVVVINKFDRKYAITADHIVGEHQAVIKPLGDLFVNQPYFSGGSIMVDGKLAFILDTNFLFNHITKI